jgi:hypothetical protein
MPGLVAAALALSLGRLAAGPELPYVVPLGVNAVTPTSVAPAPTLCPTPPASPSPAISSATAAPGAEGLQAIRSLEPVDLGALQAAVPGLQAYRVSFAIAQAPAAGRTAPCTLVLGGAHGAVVLRDDAGTLAWLQRRAHPVTTRAQADAVVDAFVSLRGYAVAANSPCGASDADLHLPLGAWRRQAAQQAGAWTVDLPLVVEPLSSLSVRYSFVVHDDGRVDLKATRRLCANGDGD